MITKSRLRTMLAYHRNRAARGEKSGCKGDAREQAVVGGLRVRCLGDRAGMLTAKRGGRGMLRCRLEQGLRKAAEMKGNLAKGCCKHGTRAAPGTVFAVRGRQRGDCWEIEARSVKRRSRGAREARVNSRCCALIAAAQTARQVDGWSQREVEGEDRLARLSCGGVRDRQRRGSQRSKGLGQFAHGCVRLRMMVPRRIADGGRRVADLLGDEVRAAVALEVVALFDERGGGYA